MTITLTLEEVQAYQKKVEEHIRCFTEKSALDSLLGDSCRPITSLSDRMMEHPAMASMRTVREKLDKHLSENPVPKLIPSV